LKELLRALPGGRSVGIARLSVPQKERLQLHGIAWCARPEAGSLTPA
jgi:hypothetical protein